MANLDPQQVSCCQAYNKSQMGLCALQQTLAGILVTMETGPIGFLLMTSLDSVPLAHKPPMPNLALGRDSKWDEASRASRLSC